jgi:hypothetical protein
MWERVGEEYQVRRAKDGVQSSVRGVLRVRFRRGDGVEMVYKIVVVRMVMRVMRAVARGWGLCVSEHPLFRGDGFKGMGRGRNMGKE